MPRTDAPLDPVIVIDLQTGMFDGVAEPPLHGAADLVDKARTVIAWARRTGRRLAFVRHDGPPGDPIAPGEPGWPIWPALGQAADEPTFSKSVGDAFSNPALETWVKEGGSRGVILLGAQSDYCVAATLKGAMGLDLGVTVVADAHSTVASEDESAADVIARQNRVFEAAGARLASTEALTAA